MYLGRADFTGVGPHTADSHWSLFRIKGIQSTTAGTLILKIYFNIILSITIGSKMSHCLNF